MPDFESSDTFSTTEEFSKDSSESSIFGYNSIIIWIVIFKIFIICLIIYLRCFHHKWRNSQQTIVPGYTIGVVNVNGQQGFIAVPPQRTVIQVQQPPPEMQTRPGLQSPPPYNPSYSQPPGYTTMPNQQKY